MDVAEVAPLVERLHDRQGRALVALGGRRGRRSSGGSRPGRPGPRPAPTARRAPRRSGPPPRTSRGPPRSGPSAGRSCPRNCRATAMVNGSPLSSPRRSASPASANASRSSPDAETAEQRLPRARASAQRSLVLAGELDDLPPLLLGAAGVAAPRVHPRRHQPDARDHVRVAVGARPPRAPRRTAARRRRRRASTFRTMSARKRAGVRLHAGARRRRAPGPGCRLSRAGVVLRQPVLRLADPGEDPRLALAPLPPSGRPGTAPARTGRSRSAAPSAGEGGRPPRRRASTARSARRAVVGVQVERRPAPRAPGGTRSPAGSAGLQPAGDQLVGERPGAAAAAPAWAGSRRPRRAGPDAGTATAASRGSPSSRTSTSSCSSSASARSVTSVTNASSAGIHRGAEHRHLAGEVAGGLGQVVQARGDHGLDGERHHRRRAAPALALLVQEHAGRLHDEERVAAGCARRSGPDRRVVELLPPDSRASSRLASGSSGSRCSVTASARPPPQPGPLVQEVLARDAQREQRHVLDAQDGLVDQVEHRRLRGVEVLEDQDERAPPRPGPRAGRGTRTGPPAAGTAARCPPRPRRGRGPAGRRPARPRRGRSTRPPSPPAARGSRPGCPPRGCRPRPGASPPAARR